MYTQDLSAPEFKRALDAHLEKHSTTDIFVNICTPHEYAESHIEGTINIPLSTLETQSEFLRTKEHIYVYCASGVRSKSALAEFERLALPATCHILEGGMNAWNAHNFPRAASSARFPLMQQMFLLVGTGTAGGALLGYFVYQPLLIIPFIFGCGLIYAGYSGNCYLTKILASLPWNKV